jgi:DHA2 family multidrug resistance protein
MQSITFGTIAPERRNGAVSVYALSRNIGQSMSVAASGALFAHSLQASHADMAALVTPYNRALEAGGPGYFWNLGHLGGRAALDAEIGRQAMLIAYLNNFRMLMCLALAALPAAFLLRVPKRREPRVLMTEAVE